MNISMWLQALDSTGFAAVGILASILWQSSILLAGVAILAYFLRRRNASTRHILWTAAVCAIPLLPLLTAVTAHIGAPHKELTFIPAYETQQNSVTVSPQLQEFSSEAAEEAQTTSSGFVAPPQDMPAFTPPPVDNLSENSLSTITDYPWASVFIVYLLGVSCILMWILAGRLRIRSWIMNGSPVMDIHIIDIFQRAGQQLGLQREFIVIENSRVPAPMTCRTFLPVIILPDRFATSISTQELEAVAVHELSHIRRNDVFIFSVLSVIKAVLFFHPFAWLAVHRVSYLAELACDSEVVYHTRKSLSYAEMLTRLAEHLPNHSLTTELAAGIIFSKSTFLRRIEAILYARKNQIRRLSRRAVTGTVVAAVMTLVLALALPLGYARERGETVTISGKVVYKGEPVKGAEIYFNELTFKQLEKVGKTDKDGRYSFEIESSTLDISRTNRPAIIVYSPKHSLEWQQLFHTTALDNIDITLHDPLSITGTVKDTSGNPLKGAEVSINRFRYHPVGVMNCIFLDKKSSKPFVCTTNGKGNFNLQNLPAGSYGSLIISKKGYAEKAIENFKLGAGSNFDITLEPERIIKGKVTNGLNGTPVKKVRIIAETYSGGVLEATTDNNGFYTFSNISEGYVNIYVMSDNPAGTIAVKEMMLIKKGETVSNLDFVTGQSVIISGRVIDEDTGEPISNHRIGYHKREPDQPALCYTLTDESGMYRFNTAPGSVWILTSAPTGYEDDGRIIKIIKVIEGENTTVEDFSFKKSTTMQGVLLTGDGTAVPEAMLIVTYKFKNGTQMLNMYSDKNGTFTLSGFQEGESLTLQAQHPRLKVRGIKNIEFNPSKAQNLDELSEIELQSEEIELILEKYETTNVSGKVVDFSGNPLPNASICLSHGTANNMGITGMYVASTLTDKNGFYTFDELIIGDVYNVESRKVGYATPSMVNKEDSFNAQKNMHPHNDLKMIKTNRTLDGIVTDDEGNPVSGAFVYVASDGMSGRAMSITDSEGQYRLENLAEVVIRTLRIKNKNYGSYSFYDIPTNETHNFSLLKPLGSFSGKIVDSKNNPVEGSYVFVESKLINYSGRRVHKSGFELESPTTDKLGNFQFKHIIDELLDLKVWHNDLGSKKFKNVDTTTADDTVLVFDKADESTPAEFTYNPNDLTLLEGNPAPNLKVDRWLSGKPVRLSDYKGKVVFLDFCESNERSITGALRKLNAYKKAYGEGGMIFVSIIESTDDIDSVNNIIKAKDIPYSIALDKKSLLNGSGGITGNSYGIKNRYRSVIIDRNGNVHLDIPNHELEIRMREYLKSGRTG